MRSVTGTIAPAVVSVRKKRIISIDAKLIQINAELIRFVGVSVVGGV